MGKFARKPQRTRNLKLFTASGALAAGLFFLSSCAGESWESLLVFNPDDLRPPRMEKLIETENNVLEAHFDKAAWVNRTSLFVYPDLRVDTIEDGAPVVRFILAEASEPGTRYTLEMSVKDENGNTCSFLYHFYGFNPRIPRMVINEVILNTPSSTVYNQAEIVILSSGNMAGVTFFEGTKSYADKTFMFPSLEVLQGDFILVHFNTAEAEGEINETHGSKTEASGKGASNTAWDFWLAGTGNLTKDNDVLSLYTQPEGDIIDGLLYTSKVYEAGAKYNGFGTSLMLNKAIELAGGGGWNLRETEPYPEDGFNPAGATSTRSICRDSVSTDTNSAEDWHIVPTGKRTPGAVNSNEVYQ
jgi:hypothetical protein